MEFPWRNSGQHYISPIAHKAQDEGWGVAVGGDNTFSAFSTIWEGLNSVAQSQMADVQKSPLFNPSTSLPQAPD